MLVGEATAGAVAFCFELTFDILGFLFEACMAVGPIIVAILFLLVFLKVI